MNKRIRINGKLYEAVNSDYYTDLLKASMGRKNDYEVTTYKDGYLVSLTKKYGSYNGAVVVITRLFIDPDKSTTTLSVRVENGYDEALITKVGRPSNTDINNFDDLFEVLDLVQFDLSGTASEISRLTDKGKLHVFDLIDPKVFNRVTNAISDFVDAVDDLKL